MEWFRTEAFRSAFQLLRARQSPYFYVCAHLFTCLFCAAGTQGDEQTQVYVTPSTKGLREALKAEGNHLNIQQRCIGVMCIQSFPLPLFQYVGIAFTTPYCLDEGKAPPPSSSNPLRRPLFPPKGEEEDEEEEPNGEIDEEPEKWLDEIGISQTLSLVNTKR